MQRRDALVLFASTLPIPQMFKTSSATGERGQCSQSYVDWAAEVIKRMETIKPGVTRKNLLTAFTAEGGLSTGLQRTYVSRDCPYFKVDVEFHAEGRPDRDANGRVTLVESDHDAIRKISTHTCS
jgi:hypothetical protein